MKKTILILFISVLLLTGCSIDKNKNVKYEKIMEEYGMNYYDKFQKEIKGISKFKVSILELQEANRQERANYDLSKFGECKSDSLIEINVDETNGDVKSFEVKMNC